MRRAVHTHDGPRDAWGIAVETPVEIGLNGAPFTLMLATPADLEDLAVGVVYTERALNDFGAIERIEVFDYFEGMAVNAVVPADRIDAGALQRRSLEGRTGCGLCGMESLAALRRRLDGTASGAPVPVPVAAISRAFAALPAHQRLNEVTRSVHAAAWCTPDGEIGCVREDVGRHNALDKVIGALARAGRLGEAGFVVMTSRCSFELVYKAAAARASLLATISAPTSLALEWAGTLGVPLACCGPGGEITFFDQGESDGR